MAHGGTLQACPWPRSPAPLAGPSRPQPGRRETPAGCTGHAQTAARSRCERASAPPARATYLGAPRPRMLQVWAVVTSVERTGAWAAAIADTRGGTPPPPGPGCGGHAGGLAGDLAAQGPRTTSGMGGAGPKHLAGRGRGGGGAGLGVRDAAARAWACAPVWRSLGPRASVSAAQPRGRTAAGIQPSAAPEASPHGANSPPNCKDGISWAWHELQSQTNPPRSVSEWGGFSVNLW